MSAISKRLGEAAWTLAEQVDALAFSPPVAHVYNPLDYARPAHRVYLERYGATRKRIVFFGMNPGPFGMMQTGVPFGEVAAVRDWMQINATIERPRSEHPKRRIEGFACTRSEVSGRRLWALFASRFTSADEFFNAHFVVNYCPLVFLEASGRNRTPDKLPAAEAAPLYAACDDHLRDVIRALEPEWVVGIGGFAKQRAHAVLGASAIRLGCVLHPSPASPAANRDWAGTATRQLIDQGIWSE